MLCKNIFQLATLLWTLNLHHLVQKVTCAGGLLLNLEPEMLSKIQQKIRLPVELVAKGQFRPQIWVAEDHESQGYPVKNSDEKSSLPLQKSKEGGLDITRADVHRLRGDEEKFTKFVENIAGVIRRETESFEDSVEIFDPATFQDDHRSAEVGDNNNNDAKKVKTTQHLQMDQKKKTRLAQLVDNISTHSHVVMDNIRSGLDVLEKGLDELKHVISSRHAGDDESGEPTVSLGGDKNEQQQDDAL